jgi:hypothetical protein
MKIVKILHSIFSIIPFIWLILILTILFIGFFKLGYFPKYGNIIDPNTLGLRLLNILSVIVLFGSFISCIIWTLIVIYIISQEKGLNIFKTAPTFLFFIGISGFIILNYIFTDYYLWVLD